MAPPGTRPDATGPGQTAVDPSLQEEPGRQDHDAQAQGSGGIIDRIGSAIVRLVRVWQALSTERRLAVAASAGLFATLFLPWYQETVITSSSARLQAASASVTGWGAFSFVEAALLVVVAAVLTLLFQRAEGRAFHLPGGDGFVVMAAGAWACLLVIWRIFDKQGTSNHGQVATTSGVEWGIFVALAAAGLLTYAGARIRAARQPEAPLPGEAPAEAYVPQRAAARPRPRTSAATTSRTPPRDPDDEPTLALDEPPA